MTDVRDRAGPPDEAGSLDASGRGTAGRGSERGVSGGRLGRAVRRPVVAALLLLAVYVALSFLNDPRGYLGTDTGGKVATLRAMEHRGGLDPDVGYWASRWDPAGRLHPLYFTTRVGSKWVNATTLPALYLAAPLYRLGGYRLALLVPMLGAVLTALAARALARRIGGPEALTFWAVGLLSPIAIYALDFWEHSLGVALVAWAVVLLLDVIERRAGWRGAAAAGLLLGAAATMRTEALVYGAVLTAVAGAVVLARRRKVLPAAAVGVAVVLGMVVPLAANVALERATLGATIRSQRASGTLGLAAGEAGGGRIREGLLTAVGFDADLDVRTCLIGLAGLGLLLIAAHRLGSGRRSGVGVGVVAAGGLVLLYGLRFAGGFGFVPGLAAAAPLAGVGLALGWRRPAARVVLAIALLALPLVWAVQFLGGAAAQWGGRYTLVSGTLLTVVGIAAAARLPRAARVGAFALAAAVTAFGVAWLSTRSHEVAREVAALDRRPEPVLVSRVAHLVREGGAFYGDRRWLTAVSAADVARAVEVLDAAGIRSFALVEEASSPRPRAIPGFRLRATDQSAVFLGERLRVSTFEASTPAAGLPAAGPARVGP